MTSMNEEKNIGQKYSFLWRIALISACFYLLHDSPTEKKRAFKLTHVSVWNNQNCCFHVFLLTVRIMCMLGHNQLTGYTILKENSRGGA